MYVGVDGKARQVQKAYIGVDGKAKLWYQLNTPLGSLAVGSTVKIAVGGKDYDWIVVHQGIPDSNLYNSSCSGTWLLMKDIYEPCQWHSSNANDYANSTIHLYLRDQFSRMFNQSILGILKMRAIPYVHGNGASPSIYIAPTGVFLLSVAEMGFDVNNTLRFEGAKLDYFKDCATNAQDSKRIAYYNGVANTWWLRSPDINGTVGAYYVDQNGWFMP